MEYVITADRPFEEIEVLAIEALEQRGFYVQRTFSLRSAAGAGLGIDSGGPGYSVLMLYASGDQPRPLGLVTLYEREGRTVFKPVLTSPTSHDAHAELVTALSLGGLDLCVDATEGAGCLDAWQMAGDDARSG